MFYGPLASKYQELQYRLTLMTLWTRLVMIVAAAFLAAQPVMACPMMLDDVEVLSVSGSQSHPCAEMAPAMNHGPEKRSSPSDCPAGFDCPPMLMQAQADAIPAVTIGYPDQVFVAVTQEAPVTFLPERSVLKTGPPAAPDLPPLTPVSLKQRLLN